VPTGFVLVGQQIIIIIIIRPVNNITLAVSLIYGKGRAFDRTLFSANITVLLALSPLCFINNIAPIPRPINNIIYAVHVISLTYGKGRLTGGGV